ncbi:MAG TPA: DUF4476 domain-containing protein [Chitinophagaceae bacterium]|nr:DUF4476 domain-containing protein [Chitinophagaceae bacterium]MCB9056848.1 DUF4476 domain-containing protein [Chitinophagales bacterium]HPG12659.1 DUF4476 domain-containing protein [Chitinophagaceae bacterium]
MKKLIWSFLLLFSVTVVSSQKVYFVYIQNENTQPFYVRMGDKVQSSAASGYIILSNLKDSTYDIALGFSSGNIPEQEFSVAMNQKDQGYLLKDFGEKGWGLFNLQTLAVQMSSITNKQTAKNKNERKVSEFTEILSKASDDPSLKEATVIVEQKKEAKVEPAPQKMVESSAIEKKADGDIKKEEVVFQEQNKEETPGEQEVKQEVVKSIDPIAKPEIKEQKVTIDSAVITEKPVPVVNKTTVKDEYKRSSVRKRSESSTTMGFGLVFVDELFDGTVDTISLLIPNPKAVVVVNSDVGKKEEKENLSQESDVKTVSEQNNGARKIAEAPPKPVSNALNCNYFATENDLLSLKKEMAEKKGDDGMLAEAKRVYKEKCFTTFQTKNISSLFKTQEGKYRFFDTIYQYVSDIENFKTLESEFTDSYYLNRFKAMLRN